MSMTLTADRSLVTLRDEEGGAVMLVGLCMACFLIGALWFLIGIGDAIVFRDTMQEATDHAAFTSAALHAKGMNFIAALNVILLALVAIHILLGIIHDIALVVCVVSLGSLCQPYPNIRKAYTGYAKIMKIAAKAIVLAEKGAAYGYPYLAFAKGHGIGNEYGSKGARKRSINMVPLSTSLVPGNSLVGPVNAVFGTKTQAEDSKAGLPVSQKPMNALCEKLAQVGLDKLVDVSGAGAGLNFLTKPLFEGLLGEGIHLRYCNGLGISGTMAKLIKLIDKLPGGKGGDDGSDDDKKKDGPNLSKEKDEDGGKGKGGGVSGALDGKIDPGFDTFWGKKGPFVPWSGTANGNPWQQVWAINMGPTFSDGSEHAVAIASGKLGLGFPSSRHSYYAQAEFYFDCTENWQHASCDGDDNAAYAIKWRARLRRFDNRSLKFVGALAGPLNTAVQGVEQISNTIDSVAGSLGSLGDGLSGITNALDKAADTASDFVNSNPAVATPYH